MLTHLHENTLLKHLQKVIYYGHLGLLKFKVKKYVNLLSWYRIQSAIAQISHCFRKSRLVINIITRWGKSSFTAVRTANTAHSCNRGPVHEFAHIEMKIFRNDWNDGMTRMNRCYDSHCSGQLAQSGPQSAPQPPAVPAPLALLPITLRTPIRGRTSRPTSHGPSSQLATS